MIFFYLAYIQKIEQKMEGTIEFFFLLTLKIKFNCFFNYEMVTFDDKFEKIENSSDLRYGTPSHSKERLKVI